MVGFSSRRMLRGNWEDTQRQVGGYSEASGRILRGNGKWEDFEKNQKKKIEKGRKNGEGEEKIGEGEEKWGRRRKIRKRGKTNCAVEENN